MKMSKNQLEERVLGDNFPLIPPILPWNIELIINGMKESMKKISNSFNYDQVNRIATLPLTKELLEHKLYNMKSKSAEKAKKDPKEIVYDFENKGGTWVLYGSKKEGSDKNRLLTIEMDQNKKINYNGIIYNPVIVKYSGGTTPQIALLEFLNYIYSKSTSQ